MTADLTERTALVTGAAGGIGREIVLGLLHAGARVVATDVSEDGLAALSKEATGLEGRLRTELLDISRSRDCAAMISAIEDRHGSLDILINNAAVGMGLIRDDHMTNLVEIEEIEPEIWDRFVRTNFSGAWYLTKAAVPGMKRAGWGRIITITTSFFTMLRGKFHPYGPCKAGLEAMAAGHAAEFDGTGITVNVVVPGGPTDTPFVPDSSGFKRSDLIKPSVMVPPIVWLCGSDGDRVTGNRYVAANWDPAADIPTARSACEAPIAWPELAGAPVWPGNDPNS
jgi:NAD(P)-dependent dehydrogenase (short-subunit alcohol dehydrogenase family)